MKECDGGRRGCWAYATERPGFSIVQVLLIHILCSRQKILAVRHMSSAPRRLGGGHLVGSENIWRRAPQLTRWQDVRYFQELAPAPGVGVAWLLVRLEKSLLVWLDRPIGMCGPRQDSCLLGLGSHVYSRKSSCFWRIFILWQLWQNPTPWQTPSSSSWYWKYGEMFLTQKKRVEIRFVPLVLGHKPWLRYSCSRENETRNGHWNTKRNPRWWKLIYLFKWD